MAECGLCGGNPATCIHSEKPPGSPIKWIFAIVLAVLVVLYVIVPLLGDTCGYWVDYGPGHGERFERSYSCG